MSKTKFNIDIFNIDQIPICTVWKQKFWALLSVIYQRVCGYVKIRWKHHNFKEKFENVSLQHKISLSRLGRNRKDQQETAAMYDGTT